MTGPSQILEVIVLNVDADTSDQFLDSFRQASSIITSLPGYVSHELHRSTEVSSSYILLINWSSVDTHLIGFRQSPNYLRFCALLQGFYDPTPSLKHFYGPPLIKSAPTPESTSPDSSEKILFDDFF